MFLTFFVSIPQRFDSLFLIDNQKSGSHVMSLPFVVTCSQSRVVQVQCQLEESWAGGGETVTFEGWVASVSRMTARGGGGGGGGGAGGAGCVALLRRAPHPPYPLTRPGPPPQPHVPHSEHQHHQHPQHPPPPPERAPLEGKYKSFTSFYHWLLGISKNSIVSVLSKIVLFFDAIFTIEHGLLI